MKYYWASKRIHFNWNKAADKAARGCCPLHWLDADLWIGMEEIDERTDKYRDWISLYGESTWTEEGYGWYDRDKPGGECAGLSLDGENRPPSFSMPTKQTKKAPAGWSHITHCLCSASCYWIVLLRTKSRKKSLIFGEYQCGERFSFIFQLSWVLWYGIFFSFWEKQKFRPSFCKVKTASSNLLLQMSCCCFTRCIYTQRSLLPLSNHHVYHTLKMHRMKPYNYTTQ